MNNLKNEPEKLDDAYEKFMSLKEGDKDTVPEPDIDGKATKLDSFICVVNKPIFFILFVINVGFMLYAVSFGTLGTLPLYIGCLIEMVVTNLILFYACYKIKLTRGTLRVHKVKFWQKLLLIGGAIILGLIVSITLAFYQVNRYADSIGRLGQPNSIITDGDETSAIDEDEIVNELAGVSEEN